MASPRRYQSLGPLLSGEGSRAFLGLSVAADPAEPPYPVVLVWIPKDVLKDKARLDVVLRETRHAMQLDHPNIFRVHGLSTQSQGLARVVEYANAESLRRVVEARGKIPVAIAAKLVTDAAMGVHYAHVAGNDDGTPLVHGDLRPQTLFVGYHGVCKVSGYGALAAAPREVGGRRVPGRRHHCAPEQVLGGRSAINVQTDIYLLGLVLLECITGKVPFEDEKSEADFDQAVLTKPVGELPEIPTAVAEVIRRAMAKKASDRYGSALEFKEALERSVAPMPTWQAVAEYLAELFPETHPTREARRTLVEKGLGSVAGYASLPSDPSLSGPQALGDLSTSAPRPIPREAQTLAAAAAAVVPQSKSGMRRAPPSIATKTPIFMSEADMDAGSSGLLSTVTFLVVLVAVVAGALAWPFIVNRPMLPGEVIDAGVAMPGPADEDLLADDAMSSQLEGEVEGSDTEEVDAGLIAQGPYDPDSGIPALDVRAEPRVGVSLNGHYLGRTPLLHWPAPPGRAVLALMDRSRSVNVTKTIMIADAGVTRTDFYLSKGYINVSAPEGAQVVVDGHPLGTGPMRDVGVYEGHHHIQVKVNRYRWEETFEIVPQQHLTFTVDFD